MPLGKLPTTKKTNNVFYNMFCHLSKQDQVLVVLNFLSLVYISE